MRNLTKPKPQVSAGAVNGWPSTQMTVEEKKAYITQQITLWVGNQRLDQALKAEELGQLSMVEKMVALRNGLIVGCIRHCRLNRRADTRLAILTLITFLADNNDGICYLSVTAMMEIFQRSREAIVNGIKDLEAQGQIGVSRKEGMPSCYWPLIPAALAAMCGNPVWFVNALKTSGPKVHAFHNPQEAVAAAMETRSSGVDQSSGIDRSGAVDRNRTTPVDELVKSSPGTGQVEPCSISTLNSAPNLDQAVPIEEQALALYNEAASTHGFTPCVTLTDARRKLIARRLTEIGGIHAFGRALSAIPRDAFLLGRVRKPGQEPFRLNIDKLLSTDTRLQDVLARLLDMAGLEGKTLSEPETDAERRDRINMGEEAYARYRALKAPQPGKATLAGNDA